MSFQLMAWAAEQKTGSPTRKAVLLALANCANHQTGRCDPRIGRIAAETELGESTVRRALGELVDAGLIERDREIRRDHTFGGYAYRFPHLLAASTPPLGESDGPASAASGPEPGKDLEPGRPKPDARSEQIASVTAKWSELAPPLIEHRESYFSDAKTKAAIGRALRTYPVEAVVAAVENYATVLAGDEYRWDYRWTIVDFLKRGLDRFVPEAQPLRNFRVRGEKFGRRDVSSREFTDVADRLKAEREASERRELAPG